MSGRFARKAWTAVLAAGVALTAPPAAAVPDPSGDQPISELLMDFQELHRKAEKAEKTCHGSEEKLKRQRSKVKQLSSDLARARAWMAVSRNDVGRLAREQYRSNTGLTPYLRLLLSDDPQRALLERRLTERIAHERVVRLARLAESERRLGERVSQVRKTLDKQHAWAAERRKQCDTVRRRLGEVEEALLSLSTERLERVRRAERQKTDGV